MRSVFVLRNDPVVPPGLLADVLDERGIAWGLVALDESDALPGLEDVAALIVLGGRMGVYDEGAYPYLAAEKRYLAAATAASIPVLGICLGCQLLADGLGGRAYLAEQPECRFGTLEVMDDDPVLAPLSERPVLSMHQDTWDLPPGGLLVARTEQFPQAFRYGSALGLQPHPEASPDIVAGWVESAGGVDLLRRAGSDGEWLVERMLSERAEVEATAHAVFGAWLDGVGALAGTTPR